MSENLFNEFEPVSSKQWKHQIQFELKGADYNESVVWESPEGIKVKPFYHKDEFKKSTGAIPQSSPFKICQNIFVHDVEKSAARALSTLKRGAESIRFTLEEEKTDIEKLVSSLPSSVPVYFNLGFLSVDFVQKLNSIAEKKQAVFFVQLDPIGRLAKDGNWFSSLEKDFDVLNTISIACPHIHFTSGIIILTQVC